jgi:capsular polysaccharide biosynthesis protein
LGDALSVVAFLVGVAVGVLLTVALIMLDSPRSKW